MASRYFLFLVALILAIAVLSPLASADDTIILHDSDFDSLVKPSEADWLIKFYAPWCGHCKRMAPTYTSLASSVKDTIRKTGREVRIAKIDCTQERGICDRFAIRGFPTVKLLSGASQYKYSGDRTLGSLIDFVDGAYQSAEAENLPEAKPFAASFLRTDKPFHLRIFGKQVNGWVVVGLAVGVISSLAVVVLILFLIFPPIDHKKERAEKEEEKKEEEEEEKKEKEIKQD